MRQFVKYLVAAAALILAVLFSGFFFLRTSLPQTSGTASVPDIRNPVEIVRDARGIPHIFAASSEDAYFGLGFAHAQDRLWQLEMHRRIAAGRLAEAFGREALEQDKLLRTLGIRRAAEAIYRNLDGDTQSRLTAYANGINAYIETRRGALPPEFLLSGLSPERWWAVDSVAWMLMMSWDLGGNWREELARLDLSRKLTAEQLAQFLPLHPGETPVALPDLGQLYAGMWSVGPALAVAEPDASDPAASNNWAVAGSRTESGKPLLANDPHLGLTTPSVWYLAQLSAPDLEVIGGTIPGIPSVAVGHNRRIAWGMTNTAPDVQDLYVEEIDPVRADHYLTPTGYQPFRVIEERIRVKGGQDALLRVRATRHGPVVSDVIQGARAMLADKYVLAFAWTALAPDNRTMATGHALAKANNWNEFLAAARDFHAPQNSFVYADVDGNIGMIAPGRVPIRKPGNSLRGLAPAPGWDAIYDWAGFIPFEQLPKSYNPASGKIATANQRIVPDDYPYSISLEWGAPPYRARRIDQLLDATPRHTVASFAAMQGDVISLAARDLLPHIRHAAAASDQARSALDLLRAWNGEMRADRPEPVLFHAWVRELNRAIYADELGDRFSSHWQQRVVFLKAVLTDDEDAARWCDDVTTPSVVEECATQVARALDRALSDLRQRYGKEPLELRWGDVHPAVSAHRPFSEKPLLGDVFDIAVPSPGDTWTVNVGAMRVGNDQTPFTSRHAASLRVIYDLSDLDRSRFVIPTGQSGNRLSGQYADQSELWRSVDYLPMSMQRGAAESGGQGTLRLIPR